MTKPQVLRTRTVPVSTAERMAKMAEEGLQDTRIVELAKKQVRMLETENANPVASQLSEISAIYHLVLKNIRYTRDPHQVELVYGPSEILNLWKRHQRWAEDCDTIALVTATLLASIGMRTRFALVGFSSGPESYSHIFCEAYVYNHGWLAVDPSMEGRVYHMAKSIKHARHFPLWERNMHQ